VGEWGKTKTAKKNKIKKKPWRWDPIHQKAFDIFKAAIAKETVLVYLGFSKSFEIHGRLRNTVASRDSSG
jgi:hypothetical protein